MPTVVKLITFSRNALTDFIESLAEICIHHFNSVTFIDQDYNLIVINSVCLRSGFHKGGKGNVSNYTAILH